MFYKKKSKITKLLDWLYQITPRFEVTLPRPLKTDFKLCNNNITTESL